ncbi:GNAT family N-acetyltransferase [Ornithinibacillus contaminans]|uniref:GNAT family N-acetyltransferase n=1 Tax=Ornithinibacillus contaminans TaxID=694055 RepID=UPI00064E1288|nr:GNAT family N-acetyltransferase [Ornithinibacillus contaminans]
MEIKLDDLTGEAIKQLIVEHLKEMGQNSPAESIHALDLTKLKAAEITFWSAWEEDELVGCGALKELDATHGEIKSMRTSPNFRGRGVAKLMLQHIIAEATKRGYLRLSLETGTMAAFEPARNLYKRFGFNECEPFAEYIVDPNSVFMTKELA